MATNESRFAYAIGRTRVLETRLLDRAKLERILDARDAEETLKALQETEYGPFAAQVRSAHDYEEVLAGELRRVRDLVASYAPDPDLTTVFFGRYDFHNLRVLLKATLQGIEAPGSGLSRVGTVALGELQALVRSETAPDGGDGSDSLEPRLGSGRAERVELSGYHLEQADPVPAPFRRAAHEAVQAFRSSGDPQAIDLAIDRIAQEHYLGVAHTYEADFLRGYLTRLADLTNLAVYLRVRRMGRDAAFFGTAFLPGGTIPVEAFADAFAGPVESVLSVFRRTAYEAVSEEGLKALERTGRFTRLEVLTAGFLMEYLRGAKHIHFNYPAVFAYVMAKEAETRLLRLIFVGKLNGVPRDKIAERLFETYV